MIRNITVSYSECKRKSEKVLYTYSSNEMFVKILFSVLYKLKYGTPAAGESCVMRTKYKSQPRSKRGI
jgi:hypothetical protein